MGGTDIPPPSPPFFCRRAHSDVLDLTLDLRPRRRSALTAPRWHAQQAAAECRHHNPTVSRSPPRSRLLTTRKGHRMSLPTPEITLPALTTATVDKQPERSVYPPDGPDRAVLAAPRMAATALSRPRGALRAQPLCSGLTRPPAARVCATRAPEWAEVAPAPPERSRRRCGGNTLRPPAVHTAPRQIGATS